jgi:hypothetical protein
MRTQLRTIEYLLAALFVAAVPPVIGAQQTDTASLDAPLGLRDSVSARHAIEQYLAALDAHKWSRAAALHEGPWRNVAEHVLESPLPDTITFAGFLQQTCTSGLYVCNLRLRRVTRARLQAPDTLLMSVEFSDRRGKRYEWGPCCGSSGAPEHVALIRAVPRDSGYAVVTLPLYVP